VARPSIGSLVDTSDDIAEQTNLVALNAAGQARTVLREIPMASDDESVDEVGAIANAAQEISAAANGVNAGMQSMSAVVDTAAQLENLVARFVVDVPDVVPFPRAA
jgi:methyl-accepting chemotaxis protein